MRIKPKFFSINQPEDWNKGWFYGLEVTAEGLSLQRFMVKSEAGDLRGERSEAGSGKENLHSSYADKNSLVIKDKAQSKERGRTAGYRKGLFISLALDSKENETFWRRLTIEAELPGETRLRVSCYAADSPETVIDGRYVNINEFIMDNSYSPDRKHEHLAALCQEELNNPKDALIKKVRGRYLWIMISLDGIGERSPLIQKIRLYYSGTWYADYLPAMYREDKQSRGFLERYLAICGTFFDDMEDNVLAISRFFDVDTVPEEYLEWLAGWLGITGVEGWERDKLRELIRQAPEIYARRGTREGLEMMLALLTGAKPVIVEYFQIRGMMEKQETRDLYARLYRSDPYSFTVLLRPGSVETEQQMIAVNSILEEHRPSYTSARLIILEDWFYLDTHAYLEINTNLSESTLMRLDRKASLPHNTIIIDE